MRRIMTFAAAVPLALLSGSALAQSTERSRWSAEATGDAAIPTRKLAGAALRTGGGVGLTARFRVQEHLAAYAGWETHMQQSKELQPGRTLDLNDNGYTFGLRFEHPLIARTNGWLRAGGMLAHIEIEDDRGDAVGDTGHGLGWELGAGLTVPLGARLGLTPGVRFRSLSRDIGVGGRTGTSTLSYVTTGVGLAFQF